MQAPAEHLPFDDGMFDFIACRYSAHHWRDFHAGLREARRVAKKGAPAVFIDAYAPGVALFDTHVQAVELLRDTSHGRDYSLAEWTAALGQAGFMVRGLRTWQLRMDFPVWTARMRTPDDQCARHSRASTGGLIGGARTFRHRAGRLVHARHHDDGSGGGVNRSPAPSPSHCGRTVRGWPCAVSLFLLGRLFFITGYRKGAGGRAFGFALTFYPTVAAYLIFIVAFIAQL